MGMDCATVADKITRKRPFVYLPDVVVARLAPILNQFGRACAVMPFVGVLCDQQRRHATEGTSSGRGSAESRGDPPPWCYQANSGIVHYYLDGTSRVGIRVEVTVAGLSETLKVTGHLEIAQVGALITYRPRTVHEFWESNCPDSCQDDKLHGRLAIELVGELRLSSVLARAWNRAVISGILNFDASGGNLAFLPLTKKRSASI